MTKINGVGSSVLVVQSYRQPFEFRLSNYARLGEIIDAQVIIGRSGATLGADIDTGNRSGTEDDVLPVSPFPILIYIVDGRVSYILFQFIGQLCKFPCVDEVNSARHILYPRVSIYINGHFFFKSALFGG